MPRYPDLTPYDDMIVAASTIQNMGVPLFDIPDYLLSGVQDDETGEVLFEAFEEELVEEYRLALDFPTFAKRHLKIRTKDSKLVPFRLNRAQKRVWEKHIKPKIVAGEPIRIYALKARQVGFTTFFQGLVYWACALNAFTEGVCVAHDKTKASDILNIAKRFYQASDPEFRPTQTRSNRHELVFANPDAASTETGLQSGITVDTADSDHLGASKTLQWVHLSEFCRYPEVNKNIKMALATLRQSIPRAPFTFLGLESTARGHNYSKEVWDQQDNGYIKVFLSWVSSDEYTVPEHRLTLSDEDIDSTDDYGDEMVAFTRITRQLIEWYPKFKHDSKALRTEALCRLQWRREKIKEDCEGDPDIFMQEFPTIPEEAFITTGSSVFSKKILDAALTAAERENPTRYSFNHAERKFVLSQKGELWVWEAVTAVDKYTFGVDIGAGITSEGDPSVINVFNGRNVQVAKWSGVIEPDLLADICYYLIQLYTYRGIKDRRPFVVPEANSYGLSFVKKLTGSVRDSSGRKTGNYGYREVYKRQVLDRIKKVTVDKWGFVTSRSTKPAIIHALASQIRDGTITFRDPTTIKELLAYQRDEKGSYNAPSGQHDDHVISSALSSFELKAGMIDLNAGFDGQYVFEVDIDAIPTNRPAKESSTPFSVH